MYWELRYIAQPLLPRYFPSIEDFRLVEAVLGEDVDAERAFAATRLPGAPDPKTRAAAHDREAADSSAEADSPRGAAWAGVPREGVYREILNTDSHVYGGGDITNGEGIHAEAVPQHGYAQSISLALPPLGAVVLRPESGG